MDRGGSGDGGAVTLRTELRPGDLGRIAAMHGAIYAREYGFDATFEAYVAGPLAELALRACGRERIWIAERDGAIVGCVAIVDAGGDVAQLRWFLVDPGARGRGLGRTLMEEAVAFCREAGYRYVILWTVSLLEAAARIYRSFGFAEVESRLGLRWGVEVVEQKYALDLESAEDDT